MIQFRIMWMFVPAVLLLVSECGVGRVEARTISGEIDTKLDTQYVTRFVFQPNELGTFRFRVKFRKYIDEGVQSAPSNESARKPPSGLRNIPSAPNPAPNAEHGHWKTARHLPPNDYYRMVIYNDKPEQWPYVRKNEDKLTCLEKQQVAINGGIVISLSPQHGCTETVENGVPYIVCDTYRSWKDFHRARWWYITFQNCGTHRDPGLTLSYEFFMTNGNNYLMKHFSADEKIILPTNIFFLAAYCVVMIVSFIYRGILKIHRMLHSTFQLHLWSVIIHFIGLVCMVLAEFNFAKTGILSLEWLETAGHVLTSIAMLLYILNAILIAKGFTVTRGKISTTGWIKITLVMVVYTIAAAIQYVYQYILSDERDAFNVNEIPAAFAKIGMRLFGLAWIYYAITISVKHYPGKGRFYCYFAIFFTAWFLSEPLMILITNNVIPSHGRAQIVNCAYQSMILLGHVCWLVLFYPKKYNSLFPYHLKANRVGIMQIGEVEENKSDSNSDDIALEDLDSVVNVSHECETARGACARAKKAGRPLPKYNNFLQESASNKAATPSAPVYVVPVPQYPAPNGGWDLFLASSLATPQAAAPNNVPQVSAAAACPVTTSGPAVIQTASARPGPKSYPSAKRSRHNVVPENSMPKTGGNSTTPFPACRDFSLFLASGLQAQPTGQSQPQTQDIAKKENIPKTKEFQPASNSSSFSTIILD